MEGQSPIVIGALMAAFGVLVLIIKGKNRGTPRTVFGWICIIVGVVLILAATVGLGQVGLFLAFGLEWIGLFGIWLGEVFVAASEALRDTST